MLILAIFLTPQLCGPQARTNVACFLDVLVVNLGMWSSGLLSWSSADARLMLLLGGIRYGWDYATFAGTIGLFVMLLFLFCA